MAKSLHEDKISPFLPLNHGSTDAPLKPLKKQIRIISFWILSIALLFLGESSFSREFTSQDGRQVNGEILAHAGNQIILQIGVKEFVVPAANFSLEDQQYIKEWIEKNPDAVRFKFGFFFDLEKERNEGSQGKAPGSMTDDKLKTIPYTYEMIVFNREVADVADMEVRYEIYIDDFVDIRRNAFTSMAVGGAKKARLETVAGKFTVEKLTAGGRVDFFRSFDTEFYIDRDAGRVDEAATDKVLGARLRLYVNGKMVGEEIVEEPSSRGLKDVPWQEMEPSEGTEIKN